MPLFRALSKYCSQYWKRLTIQSLAQAKKNNEDELTEGKHWLRLEVQTKGGKQKVIHWTKKGIVRLGFFIKSENAKKFRDWAEDYIVNERATPTQLDFITPYEVRRDLTTARRLLTIEKKKHRATAEALEAKIKELQEHPEDAKLKSENKQLKHTLIFLHNRLHEIMTTCSVKDLQKTLTQLTNHFQTLPNLTCNGKNLNTETVAKLSYWS